MLAAHVQTVLGVSLSAAQARLRALAAAGLVSRRRVFHGQPACYQVTREGLAAAASELPPPRIDLRGYGHDVGLAWVWLAAWRGTFGPVRAVLSERRLRSHDGTEAGRSEPFAVRLGGFGPHGGRRLHYPDLLLITPDGRRIAVELELSAKGRERREKILDGYGADARIDAVLYLASNSSVVRSIEASARRLGISSLVHVQEVRMAAKPPTAAAPARQIRRPPRAASDAIAVAADREAAR